MKNDMNEAEKLIASIIVVIVWIIVGAFTWPYSINTWLIYFGKSPMIVWWQGCLISLVPWLGRATIPVAVLTWLAMFFLN